jgi:peptidyl-prolyl cis-trans isomerase SurA
MKRWMGAAILLGALAMLTAGDVIDRIAAVVNDDVILLSEVDEKLFILDSQGQLAGKDSTEVHQIRRDILDRLIEERLVVQRARSQGITVEAQEVTARVDAALEQVKSQFPSEEAFQDALRKEGISITMLRERYESDVQQELLAQKIVGREIRGKVEVTGDQVRKFYDEHKDELPQKPEEVHLAHVVVYPIDAAMDRSARERIEAARKRLAAGEAFETVAAALSEDATRTRGGLLGEFGPGDLDPDLEAAIDTLRTGVVSSPVRTRLGYHLIEVVSREGGRNKIRHILARIEIRPADLALARGKAESALARIQGGESFGDVAKAMSDDELTRDNGGDLGWTPVEALVPAIAAMIDSVGMSGLSPVVESDRGYHIFKVLNRRSGGTYEFEDVQDRLRQYVEQQELEKAYDTWMTAVRDSAYVEVKNWER